MKPSVFRKKKGSYSEALNLSANINPSPNKYWVHIKRWSFIGENGGHSLKACIYSKGTFSESILFFLNFEKIKCSH